MSSWTTAFVLLAAILLVSAAGAAALSAAQQNSRETYRQAQADPANATAPAVLDVGRQTSATLSTLLPLLGWVMVPLGIVGLLGLGLMRSTNNATSRGRARR